MKRIRLQAALVAAAAACLTGGSSVQLAASDVVVRSNENRTYDCRGGSVTVDGGFNVLTLRNCATVIVNGGDNTIDAGVVDVIQVTGADNKITWTESADGRRPRITNEGEDNVIVSKRAAAAAPKTPGPTATKAAPSSAAPGSSSGGRIRIDEDGRKQDYDCHGASAIVNGDKNDLVFRNCDQVSVNGNRNIVAVRAVPTVLINGDDNKLTWEPADDGSRPRITDNGRGNTVTGKR